MLADHIRNAGDRLSSYRKEIFRKIARREIDPKVVDATGARPILVVDEHDLVSDVFVRAGRTGGYANLFVIPEDGGDPMCADILPRTDAILAEVAEEIDNPLHQDLEIGILMAAASTSEHGLNIKVRLPDQQGEVRDAKRLATA